MAKPQTFHRSPKKVLWITEEFLADIRKEFGGGNEEIVKVAELKMLEQRKKMMNKFMQKFRRAVRKSRYDRRPLIEEFQKSMNRNIH